MGDMDERERGEWLRDAFAGCPYPDEVVEAVRLEHPGITDAEIVAAMRAAAAVEERLAARPQDDPEVRAVYREHAALLREAAAALAPAPRRRATTRGVSWML